MAVRWRWQHRSGHYRCGSHSAAIVAALFIAKNGGSAGSTRIHASSRRCITWYEVWTWTGDTKSKKVTTTKHTGRRSARRRRPVGRRKAIDMGELLLSAEALAELDRMMRRLTNIHLMPFRISNISTALFLRFANASRSLSHSQKTISGSILVGSTGGRGNYGTPKKMVHALHWNADLIEVAG